MGFVLVRDCSWHFLEIRLEPGSEPLDRLATEFSKLILKSVFQVKRSRRSRSLCGKLLQQSLGLLAQLSGDLASELLDFVRCDCVNQLTDVNFDIHEASFPEVLV